MSITMLEGFYNLRNKTRNTLAIIMMSPIKSSAPENQEKIKELEENIVFFTLPPGHSPDGQHA